MTTSDATTSTSYSTTVYIPATAKTIHPTDDSQPRMEPPEAARLHDEDAAAAFSEWYVRWLLYGYIARTAAPLANYSNNCRQCEQAISHVRNLIQGDQTFTGHIFAAKFIEMDQYDRNNAKALVKWSNQGYKIVTSAGSLVHEFAGGEGYYLVSVVWMNQSWRVTQIASVTL